MQGRRGPAYAGGVQGIVQPPPVAAHNVHEVLHLLLIAHVAGHVEPGASHGCGHAAHSVKHSLEQYISGMQPVTARAALHAEGNVSCPACA